MIRRRRHKGHAAPLQKRESSRLSPLVMGNPVNQEADWSHEAYYLSDLVQQFTLPQVVRCASRLVPGEEHHLPVNVHVPMLLCEGRTAMKVLAKHVASDVRTQKLTETDDTIVIPSDYEGNFVRLQARTTHDKSVARSLLDIANSKAPAFVNFSPVATYTPENDVINKSANQSQVSSNGPENPYTDIDTSVVSSKASNGKQNGKPRSKDLVQQRTLYPPGSVFIVTGTTTGVVKHKRKSRHVVLLRCQDEAGNNCVIPTDQPCEVVEVEIPPTGTSKLSQLPAELMKINKYPSLVRYVYGSHPPRLTPCSRMFTLIDTFEEDSLIGCLLYPNHALMIELPMTSSLGFQVALNHEHVINMSLPRHALSVVSNRRDTFVRDLKLKCKFLHRVNQGMLMSRSSDAIDDDMPSATVRTRQYANEAFFYL